MYCIKCGVELSDSEEKCPLCGTVVFHPYIKRPDGEKPYPVDRKPQETASRSGLLFILTMLFLLPLATSLLWSGYVGGALTVFYVIVVLPMWFRRPIPVVFVAADFIAAGLYLLYINFATGGHWFLSFAFPVTGGLMIIAVGAVALMYYLRRGHSHSYRRLHGAGGIPAQLHLWPPRQPDMVHISPGVLSDPWAHSHHHRLLPAS